MLRSLEEFCVSWCEGLEERPTADEADLPDSYWRVVEAADGFVTRRHFFRMLSHRQARRGIPGTKGSNSSEWKRAYGDVTANLLIVAEDVFGDQYGFERLSNGERVFLKFFSDGGQKETLECQDYGEFIESNVLTDEPSAFDFALALDAWRSGLRPSVDEYLAFSLPLMLGGDYDISNLSVESRELRLGLLAQVFPQTRGLPDGTRIRRFTD